MGSLCLPNYVLIWVFQEIALAKKAMVYCDSDQISWTDMQDSFGILDTVPHDDSRRSTHAQSMQSSFRNTYGCRFVEILDHVFRRSRGDNSEKVSTVPLDVLLPAVVDLRVTDPKDCIHALLAVAKGIAPVAVRKGGAGSNSTQLHALRLDDSTATIPAIPRSEHHQKPDFALLRPYPVNSGSTFIEACKDYLFFTSLAQAGNLAATPLDLLFRRWIPICSVSDSSRLWSCGSAHHECNDHWNDTPSWMFHMADTTHARVKNSVHRERRYADPLVSTSERKSYHASRVTSATQLVIE